jgi:hypothetical protein
MSQKLRKDEPRGVCGTKVVQGEGQAYISDNGSRGYLSKEWKARSE